MTTQEQWIEPLGLSASQWKFLSRPGAYVACSGGKLDPNSTPRQFTTARDILERMNGSNGLDVRRGVLLADDVGLGKTNVAILVAWVIAAGGERGRVKILVPNNVMRRKWVDDLKFHVPLLNICAPALDVNASRVRDGKVGRLRNGCINVLNHSHAGASSNLACDLLIIDEAHRAKGEHSAFSRELMRQKKAAKRILILTATPFSIRLEELQRMLSLIGADQAAVQSSVRSYSRALDDLYSAKTARDPSAVAKRLVLKAEAAVDALSKCVIRHGVDDLPKEKAAFGERGEWTIRVAAANTDELELMLRMNRAQRVAKMGGAFNTRSMLDPRFDVGWRHLDVEREALTGVADGLLAPEGQVVQYHLKTMVLLRAKVATHPKIDAVAKEIVNTVGRGEKVLVFCHHHATAQELAIHLEKVLQPQELIRQLSEGQWRKAWLQLFEEVSFHSNHTPALLQVFVDWLCGGLIRSQTQSWFISQPRSTVSLKTALLVNKGRDAAGSETIFAAACRLYDAMLRSKSCLNVLKVMYENKEERLPGSNGTARVIAVCEAPADGTARSLFLHNKQPDTVIAIFNSPFGPDVLVATDKLSEGVDLHRYCRHLIHYELDPSPIRTIQRNGRLRRVDNWAAVTNKPIMYAYPAFAGTRDQKLVQIMKKRIDSFSLLLGGVQDIDLEEIVGVDEAWRNQVIEIAKSSLLKQSGKLVAKANYKSH